MVPASELAQANVCTRGFCWIVLPPVIREEGAEGLSPPKPGEGKLSAEWESHRVLHGLKIATAFLPWRRESVQLL